MECAVLHSAICNFVAFCGTLLHFSFVYFYISIFLHFICILYAQYSLPRKLWALSLDLGPLLYLKLYRCRELVRAGFLALLREKFLHLCYANRSEFLKRAFSFYFNSILGHSILSSGCCRQKCPLLTPSFLSGKIGQTGK